MIVGPACRKFRGKKRGAKEEEFFEKRKRVRKSDRVKGKGGGGDREQISYRRLGGAKKEKK